MSQSAKNAVVNRRAIVAGLVVIVIAAIAYGASITWRSSSNSPDPPSVLALSLSQVPTSIQVGHDVYYSATVTNTLQRVANVSSSDSWLAPKLLNKFCGAPTYPLSVSVVPGFYTSDNISTAPPLEAPAMSCSTQGEGLRYYAFEPQSYNATLSICNPSTSHCTVSASRTGVFSGYWKGGQIQPFGPGKYTVVAQDEWGHLSLAEFIVVPG